ncbi:MAG: antitoxin [Micrococcales bacterium]|nr:antitoxin [Micrococcales bacterium]
MAATTTRLFFNNRTQAVRLPKAVAFPDSVREVEVKVVGRARVITPAGGGWEEWFAKHEPVDDFLLDRDQGVAEERRPL